MQQLNRASSTL